MDLELSDYLRLVHPAIAVTVIFPTIGIAVYMAWQTRQRRLQTAEGTKSKIPPSSGMEHVKIGRWLAGAVVGLCLLGMLHPSIKYILKHDLVSKQPFEVGVIGLLFVATIAALGFLYMARERIWLGVFATLTGMGVILIGIQDILFKRQDYGAIFRRDDFWYVSHFYFGITATMLMIFSLAIIQDIYQDRKNRWRNVHIILNSIATLLFIAQGMTGTRDLLEIPLGWQEPAVYSCDFKNKVCPGKSAAMENTFATLAKPTNFYPIL